MAEIDGMDMPGFLSIRAWNAKREARTKIPKLRFIAEAWPQMRSR
jgi:hypothetical protein